MKRSSILCILALSLILAGAASLGASDWKIGAGYDGMYLGNIIQGASVRAWHGRLGLEGIIFNGHVKADLTETGESTVTPVKGTIYAFSLKGMYSLVEKENSRFYLGVQAACGTGKLDSSNFNYSYSPTIWTYGPLMGYEFRWPGLPEIGVNVDTGYMLNYTKIDDNPDWSMKAYLNGIFIAIGIHYYF